MTTLERLVLKGSVSGYLLENKLGNLLQEVFGKDNVKSQVSIPNSKFRADFYVTYGNASVYVEFDGPRHYTDSKVIFRDIEKDTLVNNVIRVPYWLQLDSTTFRHLFETKLELPENCEYDIKTDFKHGFISKTCVLPADFCYLGISRFVKDFNYLPDEVRIQVGNSLAEKTKQSRYKWYEVIPGSMAHMIFGASREEFDSHFTQMDCRRAFINSEDVSDLKDFFLGVLGEVLDPITSLKPVITHENVWQKLLEDYDIGFTFNSKGDITDVKLVSPLNCRKEMSMLILRTIGGYVRDTDFFKTSTLNFATMEDGFRDLTIDSSELYKSASI